ncbi:MAG TPA: phage holin family protein [Bacteroidia bacterium]|nr:phage holin family protein [Bacteroidia bacterium]
MNFIIKVLISSMAVIFTSFILPDSMVRIEGITTALIVAVVLAFLNATVKPVLTILTIPVTFLTLGLFLLVINALMIMIADYFIDRFWLSGFWSAFIFSIVLALTNSIFEMIRRRDDERRQP